MSAQMFGFAAFFAAGAMLGAAYDILRIWRAMFRSEKRPVFFQDFFYMVIAAFFTFLVNLGVNGGELRLYLFIGEILGWFAWHETIGRITVSIFRRLFNFLYRVVFDPAGAFLHRVAEKAGRNLSLCADGAGKKIQTWEKCLKHRGAVVYNQNMGRKSKTVKTECSRKGGARRNESNKRQKAGEKYFSGHCGRGLHSVCFYDADSAAGGYKRKEAGACFRKTANPNSGNQKR